MSLASWLRGRRGPARLACVASAVLLACACAGAADSDPAAADTTEPTQGLEARRLATCNALAASSWPKTAPERRVLLQRLETFRELCIEHPAFLATLGGNWLEEGNAVQALLWLERSLMLDPGQMGAQADHALALAALGERMALDELLREWGSRTDIPPLLVQRLLIASRGASNPASVNGNGSSNGRLAQSRELVMLYGYESNLDRSPRLSELTITPPDGPIDLQLDQKPQPGSALAVEGSWQAAYTLAPGSLFQAGLQAAGRAAPGNAGTDWHHVQLATSASHRWSRWRGEVLASVTAVGGNLNEPYRLSRWGLALESNGFGCIHRASMEYEVRRQSETTLANSHTNGGLLSALCPLSLVGGWTVGVALRASVDKPDDPQRAGGLQRQWSAGFRALGPIGAAGRIEATLRLTRALDAEGYSPLLESNARRVLEPIQLALEYSRPASWFGGNDVDFVAQFQAVRQDSNLAVFRYSAIGAYSGLRWRW